jgi:hypothetical protein
LRLGLRVLGLGGGVLVELLEEVELGFGDGAGGDSGDLGRGLSLADGGLGLGGEEGTVALGVGVALGDGGGDAGGAGACGGGDGDGRGRSRGVALTAGAMGGEAGGDLFLEGYGLLRVEWLWQGEEGGWAGRRCGRFGEGLVACIQLCGAHCAQNLNPASGKIV